MIGSMRRGSFALAVLVTVAAWTLVAEEPAQKAFAPPPPPVPGQPGPVIAVPATPAPALAFTAQGEQITQTGFVRALRFQFTIDPKTPLNELLPVPPKAQAAAKPVIGDDLTQVPEVQFQEPLNKALPKPETSRQTAHQIAKIHHLSGKKADGFLQVLRGQRPDLAGLPFAMGDACRTKGQRSTQFAKAVATVRRALSVRVSIVQSGSGAVAVRVASPPPAPRPLPPTEGPAGAAPALPPQMVESVKVENAPPAPVFENVRVDNLVVADFGDRNHSRGFWEKYRIFCEEEDKTMSSSNVALQEHVACARIAALMQVLAPESPTLRLGLVKYLSGVARAEATKALAKLALFSVEDEVRQAAVEALKVRRERDYTDILVQGLRYPWPAVARRAADALVKLERTDLVPQLVELLDKPDPRAPVTKEVDGKTTVVVQELVRVNHHRNCLLCHAPGSISNRLNGLTAAVPVPDEPLPEPSEGYDNSSPDLLVRIDVTYLRQDFSIRQPVADADPWPEMQRFDFLVRTRELTDAEAAAYRDKFARAEPGRPSPYQRATLLALRELTGKDAEPTAEGWRRLLDLAARQKTAVP